MSDLNDLFKLILLRSVAETAKQSCKGCKDCAAGTEKEKNPLPKFSSESEALAYAKRIVAIKPGDLVNLYNSDKNVLCQAVFTGAYSHMGFPVFLTGGDGNTLGTTMVSWDCVVLID